MERAKYIDMYKDFLLLVKKSRVGTVIPEEFTRVLNMAIEEVVTNKFSVLEMNKKSFDDLSPLRKAFKTQTMAVDTSESYTAYSCAINTTAGYRRIAAVSVNLSKTGQSLSNIKCHLLPTIEKTEVLNGYYSKPSIMKCYYIPFVDTSTQKLKIYVPSGFTTVTSNYDIYTNPTVATAANVTDANLQCQFGKEMSTQIVNVAARMYIEGNADPRYQSFLHEQQNKINN